MRKRNHQKHDPLPFSLYTRSTTTSGHISDHQNLSEITRKTTVRQGPMLGQASACTRGERGGRGGMCRGTRQRKRNGERRSVVGHVSEMDRKMQMNGIKRTAKRTAVQEGQKAWPSPVRRLQEYEKDCGCAVQQGTFRHVGKRPGKAAAAMAVGRRVSNQQRVAIDER